MLHSTLILYIDPDTDNRRAVSAALEAAGFEVCAAATAADTTLHGHPPDLVLVAAGTADARGVDVCRRVREETATAPVPVVWLSPAPVPAEERVRALDAGANACLSGPIDPAELVAQVRATLRARRRVGGAYKDAEQALREAGRRKDEFLAMLAHELRNPLAPIQAAAEVLRLTDPSPAQLQWIREVVHRQVQQLTRLVDDLRDVSRVTQGKIQLYKEVVELAAVVHRAVEISRPLIDQRHHTLTVLLPPASVWLHADAARLAQVLSNLLNNAAKYTDLGGRIDVAAECDRHEVVVRVRDNGLGIPREMLPRVFELFTQVPRSLDHAEGGMGIGLTLVRHLVGMHGGVVEASSEGAGRGSEFAVRLPLLPGGGPAGVVERVRKSDAPTAPRRVLVVEDDADSAESLAVLLRLMGHEVLTAADGPAALAAAAAFLPDVVLLDIGLPGGMTGYEVACRLRQQPGGARVRLVAVTGFGQEDDMARSRAAGFDLHLVKPVDPQLLSALLAAPSAPGRPVQAGPVGATAEVVGV